MSSDGIGTDWDILFALVAEQNRLINPGICPLCGGEWGNGLEGHKEDCPSAQLAQTTGTGKCWRRSRGRERFSTRRQRMTYLDRESAMKLVALAFYHANTSMLDARHPQPMDETVTGSRSPYRLVKLFDDGSTEPVDQAKIDLAIEWVRERGWTKAWGYWINSNAALVWAILPADFEWAWGHTELRCAC